MVENKECSEDVKKQNPKTTIGTVVEQLGAHGIPNIKRARNTYRRIFWLIVFLGGLVAFAIHCYMSVTQYLAHDVTVNLDILYKPRIVFPAVTFCNLNPVKESALAHFTDLHDLLGSGGTGSVISPNASGPMATQRSPRPTVPVGNTPNSTKVPTSRPPPMGPSGPGNNLPGSGAGPGAGSGPGMMGGKVNRKKYQDWNNIDFGAMDSRHSLIHITSDIIGAMDYTERQRTGHTIDDMLLSCTFQGFPCGPMNFTWFYNFLYGNCYTFNSGEMSPPAGVSNAGPLFGLTMSLYIEQAEYIPDIQQGAGVRVDIHSQNKMPFPEDEGVNAGPGTEAFIGVKKTHIQRKGKPFTNCTSETTNTTIFSEYFPQVEYSKLMCEKNCFFQVVLKICGCADIRFRYDDSTVACNSTDPKDGKCVSGVEAYYTEGRIPCNCTLACQEDLYKTTFSYSLWPNDKYKRIVQDGIREVSDSLKKSMDNDSSFIEKNVVKLNIFYEEMTFDHIYHTETYGRYSLLSDIGGNVGLWIGVSVLTIVEILELAYDIILLCFAKARSAGERSPSKQTGMHASEVEMVDKTDPALRTSSSFDDKKY